METRAIRIKTHAGRMIYREAQITNWIGSDGQQWSTAQVGRTKATYRIIGHDADGAIWAAESNIKAQAQD